MLLKTVNSNLLPRMANKGNVVLSLFLVLVKMARIDFVSCAASFAGLEPDSDGKMRWILPSDESCDSTEIRLGGVNMQGMTRPLQVVKLDGPPISDNRTEVKTLLQCPQPAILTGCISEGHIVEMKCSNGKTLDIKWAFYGNENVSVAVCPYFAKPHFRACGEQFLMETLARVQLEAQNAPSCQFEVNNHFFNGDPCPNIPKYLAIKYSCA